MNRHAIYHMPDTSYCFPISKNEITLRLRVAKSDAKEVWIIYESKYVIAKKQKRIPMLKAYTGELYDYYTVTLSLNDTRLAYIFYIYDGEKYYYFCEDGLLDDYDYSLAYYNFFQYPFINEADIMPRVGWTDRAVWYQIFVDRFCIGDTLSDKSYVNMKWGARPTAKSHAGGDIRGIIDKLDYIESLGVNAIYLTPIFKSISNHKYDICDYMQVDEQFGTNEDLKELVDKAHARNIRIILDAVFNHCSDASEQFRDVVEKGRASAYYDWFIINGDKPIVDEGNYEMFASCHYMPKLNTSNSDVQKYLCDIGLHYIEKYGIDGWRLDVSDEVSHDMWRAFRKAIKSYNADCIIVGENWHDASNYLHGDQYDSIMNYAFTKACLDYFAMGSRNASQMAGKLNDILMRNTDTVNAMMLNLLDSHDTHRFFTMVGCDKIKMEAALHLLFLFSGMPCIFYGTEIFMEGGYDPDCRRCMDWKGYEEGLYKESIELLQRLSLLRRRYNLASAKICITAISNTLVVRRYVDDRTFSLYINMTDKNDLVDDIVIASHNYIFKEGEVT